MFTVCPKCTLTLAVTANDLRIGQGYVRCGRCANVFNALLTLSEEPSEEHRASPEPTPADPRVLIADCGALRDEAVTETADEQLEPRSQVAAARRTRDCNWPPSDPAMAPSRTNPASPKAPAPSRPSCSKATRSRRRRNTFRKNR